MKEKQAHPPGNRAGRKTDMTTYYCSDPHAFHANILKYCRRLAFMTDADREHSLHSSRAEGTFDRSA